MTIKKQLPFVAAGLMCVLAFLGIALLEKHASAQPTYNPKNVSGCILDFNADTLGLGNGVNVTTWPSACGTSIVATTVSGTAPTYLTGAINGHGAVRAGGSAWMTINTTALPKTVYAVVRNQQLNPATFGTILAADKSGGANGSYLIRPSNYQNAGNIYYVDNGSAISYTQSPATLRGLFYLHGSHADISAGTMTVNMSLNRLTTGGVSTNTGAFQTPTATVLFSDYNAHTIQAGDACQCDLVRLVAYDRPLSTTEEFQLADYMERTYWPTPKDRYYFYGFDNNADGYGNFLPELQTSNDLVTWTTRPIGFDGATMRDPSYLWWRGEMYQVNTCCALQFEVKHSYTGGLWTHYGNLSGGTQTGSYSSTWAPEFYVKHGSTGDTAYVFWSFDPANGDVEHQTNASYSTDAHLAINSWSAPAVVTITGANYNSIDVFLFDEGSTRYMLIKNENSGNIEVASQAASADPISGTWAMVKTGDWAGWRASYGAPVEGPSIIRRRDGKYQVFLDPINGAAPYQCSVSSGPVFASATWSAPAPCGFNAMTWPVSGNLTHGTIYDSRGQGGAVAFDPVIDQLHRGLLAMFPMPGAVGN